VPAVRRPTLPIGRQVRGALRLAGVRPGDPWSSSPATRCRWRARRDPVRSVRGSLGPCVRRGTLHPTEHPALCELDLAAFPAEVTPSGPVGFRGQCRSVQRCRRVPVQPKLSNLALRSERRCHRFFIPVAVVGTAPWTNAGRFRSECCPHRGSSAWNATMTASSRVRTTRPISLRGDRRTLRSTRCPGRAPNPRTERRVHA